MFPRLREQIGTALDLFVEFSTLGEYRLVAEAIPGASSAPAEALSQAPQLGGAGAHALRAAVRRTVAGGAAGATPVATPAARRLMRAAAESTDSAKRTEAAKPPRAPRTSRLPAQAAHAVTSPRATTAARTGTASGPGCAGDRRRAPDGAARTRVRTGAPAVTEQLCLAV
jgi:hypothetical protein